jgi:hypothetical protein
LIPIDDSPIISVPEIEKEENLVSVSSWEVVNIEDYKTIKIWDEVFSFIRWNFGLTMKVSWENFGNFPLVSAEKIQVQKIYSANYLYIISIWIENFLFDFSVKKIEKLDLTLSINYAKKIWKDYLLVTEKWIFVYKNNIVEYVDIFSDFVYYNGWYVWILSSSDNRRIKNLWIQLSQKNAIIYYNSTTKEIKLVYETNLNLTKIYLNENEIYFEENGVNTYKLRNF